ncbi:MAG: ABC transporter permease [Sneathiella sp.]|nr:MAG: ABC transporter permease [Sneathiella sp.]
MKYLRPLITICGLLLVWSVVVSLTELPKFILPPPGLVFKTLIEKYDLIAEHALITAVEIVLGLLVGISFGMVSALLISAYRPVRQWVLPMLIASQAVPVFAIAPLLVIWMGYGLAPKVIVGALIIYFPVAVGFLDGLNRTDPAWLNLAALLQKSGSKSAVRNHYALYRYIKIPFALPSLASGIRVGTAIAPIGAIVGEWVGSSAGLGFLMLNSNARMQIDLVFASLMVLTFMALTLYYLVDHGLRWAMPWQPDQKIA